MSAKIRLSCQIGKNGVIYLVMVNGVSKVDVIFAL